MSVGLAWKSAAKSNEKLIDQKYATLFFKWNYEISILVVRGTCEKDVKTWNSP